MIIVIVNLDNSVYVVVKYTNCCCPGGKVGFMPVFSTGLRIWCS